MSSAVSRPSSSLASVAPDSAPGQVGLRCSVSSSGGRSSLNAESISSSESSWTASPAGSSPTKGAFRKLNRHTPWVASVPIDDDEEEDEEEAIKAEQADVVRSIPQEDLNEKPAAADAQCQGLKLAGGAGVPLVSPFDGAAVDPAPETEREPDKVNRGSALWSGRRASMLIVHWRDTIGSTARLASLRMFQDSSMDREMRKPHKEGCCTVM